MRGSFGSKAKGAPRDHAWCRAFWVAGRGAFDSEGSRGAGGAVNQAAQRGAGSGEGDERRSEKVRAKEAIVA